MPTPPSEVGEYGLKAEIRVFEHEGDPDLRRVQRAEVADERQELGPALGGGDVPASKGCAGHLGGRSPMAFGRHADDT